MPASQVSPSEPNEIRNLLEMTNEELRCTLEELAAKEAELIDRNLKLKAEQLRYQNLFNFAPDGYLVTDASGNILEANQTILEMLSSSREVLLGKPFIVFIDPKHFDLFYTNLNHLLSQPEKKIWEFILIPSQRNPFTAEVSVSQNLNPINNQLQLHWFVRDISDRKKTETDLWQAHQELNYHIENSPLATIIWDHEFRVRRWSARAEEIFGWKSEEVLGKKFDEWQFVFEEDIPQANQVASQLLRGEKNTYLNRNYQKDGSVIHCQWYNSVLLDRLGNIVSMISFVENVSDRILTESALKQSEAKQRALLNALPDLIMRFNREGIYLDFLPAKTFQVIGNAQPDNFIGARIDEILPPDLAKKQMIAIASALETKEMQIFEQDLLIEGIWQAEECRVVVCGEDEVMIVARDISDRKQSELKLLQALEAIQELNSQLEQRVQERTEELSQARNFLQSIIDYLPISLFVKDGRPENFGKYLLWNSASEVIFGCPKSEAIGKTAHDIFPKAIADSYVQRDLITYEKGEIEDIPENSIVSLSLGNRLLHTIKVPIFDQNKNPQYLICISEDITDHKQAEINLQESNELFRATFEQAAAGIVQVDLDGGYIKTNQKYCDIVGYSEAELLSLKSFAEITHPDDLQEDIENCRRLLLGELQTFTMEKRFIRKDGEIVWTNLAVSLTRNYLGEPQHFIGVTQDITDQKQAEINLIESNERFRAIFEQAAVGIVQTDLNGKYIQFNQKYCDILGYSEAEILSLKSFTEITHPDDLQEDIENCRRLLSGESQSFSMEKRYIRKDGESVWTNLSVSLTRNFLGEPQYFIGVAQDINERKHAEIQILESQRFIQTVLDTFPLSVFWIDRESVYLGCNLKFAQAAGLASPIEIVGKTDYELPWTQAETELYRAADLEIMESKQAKLGIVETITLEDGTTIWIETNKLPLYNLNNEVIGVLGTFQDISDRKQAEEERDSLLKKISRLNFKLEQKVEERTQELSEAIQDLKTTQQELILSGKMAVLGQLTASIAHEINTPLGVIQGSVTNIVAAFNTSILQLPILLQRLNPEQKIDFFDLVNFSLQQPSMSTRAERQLLQEWEEELDKLGIAEGTEIAFELVLLRINPKSAAFYSILRSAECLEILQVAYSLVAQNQNIQNIQQEIDRAAKIVFALKTYSHHNQNDEKISIDIIDNIEVALALYANRLKQGIEVTRRYEAGLPQILGNPDQLTQVWVNLIDNAIYSIGEQGKLEILVEQQADFLMIEITDSGSGIPVEYISRLFEPFFTTKPRGEGSGLGLDIVKQIILKHDGDIQVRSEVGQTTFSVFLPLGDIDNA